MYKPIFHAIAAPIIQSYVTQASRSQPVPQDSRYVHARGSDPDRILLIGGAGVRGHGVTSYQLGVGGHLSRLLSKLTGRGTDVELDGQATRTLAATATLIERTDLDRFDAVILMLGSLETAGLLPVAAWRREMRAVLTALDDQPAMLVRLVMGVPPLRTVLTLPSVIARVIARHGRALNAATEALCAEFAHIQFMPFFPDDSARYAGYVGTITFESWAAVIAPVLRDALAEVGHGPHDGPVNEDTRQLALDDLHVLGTSPDARIDRIVQMACDLLDMSGASVTLLDNERQWIKSAVGLPTIDMPREDSFCNVTIARAELFVVDDAAADHRWASHPWVAGWPFVRFYAGYPLETPDGQRVGALCVVDSRPRRFSSDDAALLRELALEVQSLLGDPIPR